MNKNDELFRKKLVINRRLYPMTRFALTNTVAEQLAHIVAEIDEAAEASEPLIDDDLLAASLTPALALLPFLRELADVQASIETLWHILDRVFGAGFAEAMILSWVEEKNRGRGYYVEGR